MGWLRVSIQRKAESVGESAFIVVPRFCVYAILPALPKVMEAVHADGAKTNMASSQVIVLSLARAGAVPHAAFRWVECCDAGRQPVARPL